MKPRRNFRQLEIREETWADLVRLQQKTGKTFVQLASEAVQRKLIEEGLTATQYQSVVHEATSALCLHCTQVARTLPVRLTWEYFATWRDRWKLITVETVPICLDCLERIPGMKLSRLRFLRNRLKTKAGDTK